MLGLLSEELILEISLILSNDETPLRHHSPPPLPFRPFINTCGGANSLEALSCVSWQFRRILEPLLFETISISYDEGRSADISPDIQRCRNALKFPFIQFVKRLVAEAFPFGRRQLMFTSPEAEELFIETILALPNLEIVRFHHDNAPILTPSIISAIRSHGKLRVIYVTENQVSVDDTSWQNMPLQKFGCSTLSYWPSPFFSRQRAEWATKISFLTQLKIRPSSDSLWMSYTFPGLRTLTMFQEYLLTEEFLSRHRSLTSVAVCRTPFLKKTAEAQHNVQNIPWLHSFHSTLRSMQNAPSDCIDTITFERTSSSEEWACTGISIAFDASNSAMFMCGIRAVCGSFPSLRNLTVEVTTDIRIQEREFLEKSSLFHCIDLQWICFKRVNLVTDEEGLIDSSRTGLQKICLDLAKALPRLTKMEWSYVGELLVQRGPRKQEVEVFWKSSQA